MLHILGSFRHLEEQCEIPEEKQQALQQNAEDIAIRSRFLQEKK